MLIALDHWQANDIIRGIVFTIYSLYWILCIVLIKYQHGIDVFEFDKDEPKTEVKAKSKFQEKLEKIAKERGYESNKE